MRFNQLSRSKQKHKNLESRYYIYTHFSILNTCTQQQATKTTIFLLFHQNYFCYNFPIEIKCAINFIFPKKKVKNLFLQVPIHSCTTSLFYSPHNFLYNSSFTIQFNDSLCVTCSTLLSLLLFKAINFTFVLQTHQIYRIFTIFKYIACLINHIFTMWNCMCKNETEKKHKQNKKQIIRFKTINYLKCGFLLLCIK